MSDNRREVLLGIKDALPVLFAVAPYALVLGAQASQVGLSATEVMLMTALNFAGGSEFAAIELWSSPLPILTIIAITFLINSRHIIMGAALAPFIQHLPKRKILPALFFMADEGWAVNQAKTLQRARHRSPQAAFSFPYYLGACLPFYPVWVGAAVLGSIVGPRLGNIEAYGFAMAFAAVFLVLLRGMWKGCRAARPWLVSLVVAGLVHVLLPGPWFVLAGSFAGMAAAWVWGAAQ